MIQGRNNQSTRPMRNQEPIRKSQVNSIKAFLPSLNTRGPRDSSATIQHYAPLPSYPPFSFLLNGIINLCFLLPSSLGKFFYPPAVLKSTTLTMYFIFCVPLLWCGALLIWGAVLLELAVPTIANGKGRTRWFPSNNQWVRRSMGSTQPDEGSSWAKAWLI
jgi:hypothetical protein